MMTRRTFWAQMLWHFANEWVRGRIGAIETDMASKNSFVKALLMALIGILSLMQLSCANFSSINRGYKTFTLHRGIGHFSFEYPMRFRVAKKEIRNDEELKYTHIIILGPSFEDKQELTEISIFVQNVSEYYPDAIASLNRAISSILPGMTHNFTVIDIFPVTVAGIQGEQFVAWMDDFHSYGHTPLSGGELIRYIMRTVYFDNNGIIWNITMDSHISRAEAEGADFEHILQTFKVLD